MSEPQSEEKAPFKIQLIVFIYRCLGIASVILVAGAAVGFLTQKTNDDYSINPQDIAAYLQELGIEKGTFQRNLGELGKFIVEGVVANTYDNRWVFHTEGKLHRHEADFQENLPIPNQVCPVAIEISYKKDQLHYSVDDVTRENIKKADVELCVVYYVAMLSTQHAKLLTKLENVNSYQSQ